MKTTFEVRPARDGDLHSLGRALEAVRGEDLGDIAIELPTDAVSGQHAKMLVAAVRSIGGEVLIAVDRGETSGFLVLSPGNGSGSPRRAGFAVAVRSEFRRRGVGAALVSDAQRWAATAGFRYLDLWVRETNEPARALYQKLGFQPTHDLGEAAIAGRIAMSFRLQCVEAQDSAQA